jgi:nucleoside-diphosphate-sugar epimerase
MSGTVLITGAFGLVGVPTVAQFAADGWRVVAIAHRRTSTDLPEGVTIAKADLTDAAQVERVVSETKPDVIVHLAAFIPPLIYRHPAMGRKVNVDATAALVHAAEAQPRPPRFVHASSGGLYGPRNPYRHTDLLTVDTPLRPSELYGSQKLEAEKIVRSSSLDWVVLRIGGVMSADPTAMPFSPDTLYFGGLLSIDQRCHTVDNRDVASACAAAATADVVGEIFMIAGDATHKVMQGDMLASMAAARGLVGYPLGRPGDPDDDDGWYPYGDWMDVTRAQQALSFHHHSWPDLLAELRANTGWKYYPTRLSAPLARAVLARRRVYRDAPGEYTDVWGAIRSRFGEPVESPSATG